ncbi:DsbA family protein [Thermomonospora cellulosilytica]|uniref:Protein-disulfide isomerase n=1 Tax=Thermomonospora cellulosilytica TaxID=1411118 RepID=A0A7W3N2V5_9ACTN|nr:thioredoxin domain-containing protein [Thermomonospora cellulosilytica]MBA9006442.1 protein-disulfide isomerase [Thermomonospora cellulosilytica]
MSKAERQRSARERLAEQRRREEQRHRRLRALLVGAGAVAVIAVVVAAVVLVQTRGGDEGPVATAPVSRQADGSVVMAKPGVTAPVLEIYEDFQCPACQEFEEATGRTVKELAAEGKVKVVYRPFSLFRSSNEPTRGNSLRALNASLCAPADKWLAYHDKLFAEQGPETAKGFENADLVKWAAEVGITGDAFAQCVEGTRKQQQIDQVNATADRAGVQSTPWVTLDGRKLDQNATFTADGLREAVENADKT